MLLRSSLLSCLLAALAVAGCGDNSPVMPVDAPTASPDGGVEPDAPAPDAPLPPDAPPPDAPLPPDAPPPTPDAPPPVPTGQLRLVHAAPVAGPLDVYVEGEATPLFAAVAYGTATAYAALPEGSYRLVVREAGAAPTAPPIYTSEPVAIAADQSTTAIGGGLVGSMMPDQQFRIAAYRDGFAAPAPGSARVRIVHDSYSLPTVAIDVGDDGSAEVDTLTRFADTGEAGLEVAAGSDRALALVGVTAPRPKLGSFQLPSSAIGSGDTAYVVVTGLLNVRPRDPRGLVLLVVPAHGAARAVRLDPGVFLLAASADAPAIDAYAAGVKIFDNLAFGRIATRRLPPTAAGHALAFYPTGADPMTATPLATLSTGALDAGQQYLVVLAGLVAPAGPDGALALRVVRDELPLDLDPNGRIRVVHAASGVGAIDVGRFSPGMNPTWNDVADFAGIAPGASSSAAGTAILDASAAVPVNPGVRATGDGAAPLRFVLGALMNTDRFYAVVAGAWAPTGMQRAIRVVIVKTAATSWTAQVLAPQP